MTRKYKKRSKRVGQFKSELEASVWDRLPKNRTKYESDKITYFVPKTYIPDYTITRDDGHKVLLEVKGFLRYEDQLKMRYVKMANPDLDIRFYFPNDGQVHRSKMKNSEWCKKYDFPCYIGRLPRGWWKRNA